MTKRHHRAQFYRPRQPRTDTRYAVDTLDSAREELIPRFHRDAEAGDPWLSPEKSEAVRALLALIEFAQAHTYYDGYTPDGDLDLRGFCEDAELTERQTEVVLMVGEGWGQRAIANQLGISQPAVSRHLQHGRHKLVGWLPLTVVRLLATA